MVRAREGHVAVLLPSVFSPDHPEVQQKQRDYISVLKGAVKHGSGGFGRYQLVATGQTAAVLQKSLQGKAKSDGEDVLTPLLQQTAADVLGQVSKK